MKYWMEKGGRSYQHSFSAGKVIQRTIGPDGQVKGTYDKNPFLNSIIYDVDQMV